MKHALFLIILTFTLLIVAANGSEATVITQNLIKYRSVIHNALGNATILTAQQYAIQYANLLDAIQAAQSLKMQSAM